MVWFYCDDCGDTIKKPKLANHFRSCHGHTFTCVDCSRSFDRSSAASHNTCVSEHEKYALGATKPGGYASQGFFHEGQQQPAAAAAAAEPAAGQGQQEVIGLQFLSERPPWRCSCCNVNCTSRDTLLGHASGVKHKRRARAALGLTGQQQQQQANGTAAAGADDSKQTEEAPSAAAADKDTAQAQQQDEQPANNKQEKDKQGKAEKQSKQISDDEQQQEQEKADKQGRKKSKGKSKKGAAAEEAAEQQQQLPGLEPLLKVAKKKLKKKGKLGLKKLEALLQENANGSFNADVVQAVKEQLLALSQVKLKGSKTLLWQADSN